MATSSQMGAIAVNAPSSVEEAFRKYGLYVGIAYQMQDDLNDILMSMRDMSPHGDLKSFKLTMPLYILHESVPSLKDTIDLFLNKEISFKSLADKMMSAGGVKLFTSINNSIENYLERAVHSLNGLVLDSEYKNILNDLPFYMINKMKSEVTESIIKQKSKKDEYSAAEPEESNTPEADTEKSDNYTISYDDWVKTLPTSNIAAIYLLQTGTDNKDVMNKTGITEEELGMLKKGLEKFGKI